MLKLALTAVQKYYPVLQQRVDQMLKLALTAVQRRWVLPEKDDRRLVAGSCCQMAPMASQKQAQRTESAMKYLMLHDQNRCLQTLC